MVSSLVVLPGWSLCMFPNESTNVELTVDVSWGDTRRWHFCTCFCCIPICEPWNHGAGIWIPTKKNIKIHKSTSFVGFYMPAWFGSIWVMHHFCEIYPVRFTVKSMGSILIHLDYWFKMVYFCGYRLLKHVNQPLPNLFKTHIYIYIHTYYCVYIYT